MGYVDFEVNWIKKSADNKLLLGLTQNKASFQMMKFQFDHESLFPLLPDFLHLPACDSIQMRV
jgi:hypothetical protein